MYISYADGKKPLTPSFYIRVLGYFIVLLLRLIRLKIAPLIITTRVNGGWIRIESVKTRGNRK